MGGVAGARLLHKGFGRLQLAETVGEFAPLLIGVGRLQMASSLILLGRIGYASDFSPVPIQIVMTGLRVRARGSETAPTVNDADGDQRDN